jgi:hypothetical protein
MSSFPSPHTRFGYLLERYELPQDCFGIESDDSGGWLFAERTDYLQGSQFERWHELCDEHAAEYLDESEAVAFQVRKLPTEPADAREQHLTPGDRPPASTVSTESLEDARRMLTNLQDVQLEEEGEVSSWILAARRAVQMQLSERHDG